MGKLPFWKRVDEYLDQIKHKILCKLGKHEPPINIYGVPDDWCWYCEKELADA